MTEILLDRRMTLAECNKIWNADAKIVPLREMVFFRIIYAARFRPDEAVNCDIEDYDKAQHLITARKVKRRHNPKKHITIIPPPKTRKLDLTTHKMLYKLIGQRKKGPIFVTSKGLRCHVTQFQRAIHDIAETLGVQRVRYITDGGKKYYLVSLTGLREAGERHEVLGGGSQLIAARCSDHTEEVQRKHYMGVDTEEIIMQQEKHHPFFKKEKG